MAASIIRCAIAISFALCAGVGCGPAGSLATANGLEEPAAGTQPAHADQAKLRFKRDPDIAANHADAQHRALRPDDLKGLTWRCIGPAIMGGRVADIALAPGNSKTFYVAFGTGGLFKTTNAGTTFSPVFDKEATASLGSVVVADAPPDWPGWADEKPDDAPATRKSDDADKARAKIVWVGTGEGNGRNSSSWGCGVYRSTDGGATFTNAGLKDSHDIPRLAVDPGNPDVCYAAALGHLWGPNKERGVFKTSDGGKTWQAVLQIDENTGACDVVVDPRTPATVYAAMYMRRRTPYSFRSGGPRGGIYRSTDAGRSWTKLTGGLPAQTGRIGLNLYAKNPRIVYAVIESDVGGWGVDVFDNRSRSGGVFRSDDGGDTWTRMSELTFRPFYFSKIRVDPTDDQRVYMLGWGLAISDDAGRHFRAGGAKMPHGDMHALAIDPADREHLVMGTDGGVYVSWDRGATWDFLNHIAVGEFYNIALDMSDPYRVAGGLQDNGSWVGPSATNRQSGGGSGQEESAEPPTAITNADWKLIWWGDGFHVAFDPTNPHIMYAESQGGDLGRIHLDTGRRKIIKPSPKEGQPRFRFNWNTPFLVSAHNPTTLYVGGNYVFKLLERGNRWERISDDLSTRAVEKIETVGSEAETHGTVVSLAESPVAAGVLWAGTDDGRVHVTIDDGKTWTNVTPAEVGGRYISRIEAAHRDRATAYVAIDGHRNDDMAPHLMRTDDGGKSWHSVVGDLPQDAPVLVVREDLENPDVLYAGTERAIYASIDRGGHWTRLNGEGLPTVAVDDIQQHPRERDLVIGTHGRSIWVLDDASALSQLTPAVLASPLHLFKVPAARPRVYLPNEGNWTDRCFRAGNPPMGARITYWLRDYDSDDVKLAITNAAGTSIRELTGSNRPGINRVVWDLQPDKHDRFDDPDAKVGVPQFVPAGDYRVTIKQGKRKAAGTITVLPAAWEDHPDGTVRAPSP